MSSQVTQTPPLADLATIEELVAENPKILSVPTLRWQLRHRDKNGLSSACVRVGKNILLYRARYAEWIAGRAGA